MSADYKKDFEGLVSMMVQEEASDLHLSEGRKPTVRASGILIQLENYPEMSHADMKGILDAILDDVKKDVFQQKKEVDFSYLTTEGSRLRGSRRGKEHRSQDPPCDVAKDPVYGYNGG
jgi:twitching motility protein PilT